MNWAIAIRMATHPKALLLVLAHHHNSDTGLCCPSMKLLRDETGLNLAQIRHYADCLRAAGLIDIHRGGGRAVSRYDMHLAATSSGFLRFGRPPRRASRGATPGGSPCTPSASSPCTTLTVTEPEDNQNSDTTVSAAALRATANQGGFGEGEPSTNHTTTAAITRAAWLTRKMRMWARKRGLDADHVAAIITANYGDPPPGQGDDGPWARAFYQVAEAVAGGFVDAVLARGLDIDESDAEESAA